VRKTKKKEKDIDPEAPSLPNVLAQVNQLRESLNKERALRQRLETKVFKLERTLDSRLASSDGTASRSCSSTESFVSFFTFSLVLLRIALFLGFSYTCIPTTTTTCQ